MLSKNTHSEPEGQGRTAAGCDAVRSDAVPTLYCERDGKPKAASITVRQGAQAEGKGLRWLKSLSSLQMKASTDPGTLVDVSVFKCTYRF